MPKILNIKEGSNIVPDIVNAVANGYREDMILDELADAVENKVISRGQFESATDALELYSARFTDAVKSIADSMKQFEFNDEQPILKNKRLDLAQQVMQDVSGFNNAADEFDNEVDDEEVLEEKVSATDSNELSYKDYFVSKLKSFNVTSPTELTPEQWDEIDKGWGAKKESD